MDRRTFLNAAPLAGVAFIPTTARAETAELVEKVMSNVTPHRCAGYSQVRTDALRELCEATGVTFLSHWGNV